MPRTPHLSHAPRAAQRGIAAVEFAVIFPILLALLVVPIFFARVFMHYSVAQKAAHSAALYLSTVPRAEMLEQNRLRAADAITKHIVEQTVAELHPGFGQAVLTQTRCDDSSCGFGIPTTITVMVEMSMFDDFFTPFTQVFVPHGGLQLRVKMTLPYLG